MSALRLTRRGRLVVQTFPLYVVACVVAQSLTGRAGAHPERAPVAAAVERPEPRPAPSHAGPDPSPGPTPSPSPRPASRLVVAPGHSGVHGSGPLRRFAVEVESGLPDAPLAVAAAVEAVLFDQRSWGGGGRLSFQRVDAGPVAFRVVLATPETTDRLCGDLRTNGTLSCYRNGRAVLNANRWHRGAASYGADLAGYRIYMVNHEVGHALGHGHAYACGAGGLAPAMMQQTKGLRGCRANPWPLPEERVSAPANGTSRAILARP